MTTKNVMTYGFATIVLGIVAILVIPLPPVLLDVLLALNIFGSALVLLISLRVEEPLEFSAFAPALLLATLFRLSLDVSATRLILTSGHEPGGVGSIIPAFGEFVVRGNIVVGLIVFAILVTIQFIVIATGAQRVAEVSARFTLDAMPGKQMAIDADVHAGVIDAEGARRKRERVQKEADFYSAMDGAGKFVKGDAVAALIIVVLNLVGGIVVGVVYHGMSPVQSIETFSLLSVGNALVTTLPAFLISTAMGMMVTRAAGDGALGVDLGMQLIDRPDVLRMASILIGLLAFVPALPGALFGTIGAIAFGGSFLADRRKKQAIAVQRADGERAKRLAIRRPEMALGLVGVDAVSIDVGSDLFALLGPPNADALLDRIGEVRRAIAAEIGIVIPGVRLRDDLSRDPSTYAIRVRDLVAGEGSLRLDAFLAVGAPDVLAKINGERTHEPVYGLEARIIAPANREAALNAGALVFDAISIVGSHLSEVVRTHAADLLGRQELQTLVEHLRATVPSLIKDVGTEALPIAAVHRAFHYLLRERVWPRDPVAVIEAMIDAAPHSRDARDLAEAARRVLIPPQLRRSNTRVLRPLIVVPAFEIELVRAWSGRDGHAPDPQLAFHVRSAVERHVATIGHATPVIVCTGALRPLLADFLERMAVRADVYAYTEIPNDIVLETAGIIEEYVRLSAAV